METATCPWCKQTVTLITRNYKQSAYDGHTYDTSGGGAKVVCPGSIMNVVV